MSTDSPETALATTAAPVPKRARRPRRKHVPDTWPSRTAKFTINGYKGYLTVDIGPKAVPVGITLRMAKQGSMLHGLLDAWCLCMSAALRHGVPIGVFIAEMEGLQFDPWGITTHPEIPVAKSIADYVARQLRIWFPPTVAVEK